MTEERTCRCKGQFAMHKPALHADRDGSEARAQLEREHERALAAYVPEDEPGEVERLRAEVARLYHRAAMNRVSWVLWRERAEKAEAALARVESLAAQWEVGYNSPTASSWAKVHADLLRAALAEPDAEAAS